MRGGVAHLQRVFSDGRSGTRSGVQAQGGRQGGRQAGALDVHGRGSIFHCDELHERHVGAWGFLRLLSRTQQHEQRIPRS